MDSSQFNFNLFKLIRLRYILLKSTSIDCMMPYVKSNWCLMSNNKTQVDSIFTFLFTLQSSIGCQMALWILIVLSFRYSVLIEMIVLN